MIYQIKFSEEALKDIERLKESGNKSVLKKLAKLFFELQSIPYRNWSGRTIEYYEVQTLSRRINREHRLYIGFKNNL
jgi:toxin YoeB